MDYPHTQQIYAVPTLWESDEEDEVDGEKSDEIFSYHAVDHDNKRTDNPEASKVKR